MSTLPPCPLSATAPVWFQETTVACPNAMCALYNVSMMPAEWLRLAAPRPLPATVRAVLEACERNLPPEERGEPELRVGDLWDALAAWIAAGRPGLEEP